ncbi:MAG: ferrous iron transporter B [Clostridia bacterium]|nr:ferrous iron transporter B [Clostridia bacterium]
MRVKAKTSTPEKTAMRAVLAGNPNAGKTTLFNALTKSNLRTGNFHGVTTSPAQKTHGGITYVDAPGLYALSAYSMEEVSAGEEVKGADVIINVVDALTLENSLNLTHKLIASGKPVVMYLTKCERLKRRGGSVDIQKLSKMLGIPVFNCPPKQFKKQLESGINFSIQKSGVPFPEVYKFGKEEPSRADKLFYNRFFALAFFIISIAVMFFTAFHSSMPGAILKDLCEKLICEDLCGLITSRMQNEVVISLLEEGIISGAGGVLCFIPQLAILYLFLILLDESGILSALAFATDGLFEKVNLSGRAAFSLVSGFGCTSVAISTTRGYSTGSAQKRTVAVLAYIPCGAKLPVFLTFLSPLFKDPFPVITCLYFAGILISLAFSKLLKGGTEGLLSEVTPIVFPDALTVVKKLYFNLKGFIIKVAGIVTLFCIASWLLSHFSFSFEFVPPDKSMLAHISRVLVPAFYPMGITDWRIAYAALCGFIAKENVAATVAMLMPFGAGLDMSSALAMCAFILLCPACVSAFSVSCKEVGVKFTLKCFAVQTVIAFIGAYIVHLIFIL